MRDGDWHTVKSLIKELEKYAECGEDLLITATLVEAEQEEEGHTIIPLDVWDEDNDVAIILRYRT